MEVYDGLAAIRDSKWRSKNLVGWPNDVIIKTNTAKTTSKTTVRGIPMEETFLIPTDLAKTVTIPSATLQYLAPFTILVVTSATKKNLNTLERDEKKIIDTSGYLEWTT